MFAAMFILPLGLLIFGVTNWRAAILSRWNKLPLITGALTTFLIATTTLEIVVEQQTSENLFVVYLALLATGWLGLGVAMVRADEGADLSTTAALP